MLYELTLETYKGPLDKLLELVETKKLEITEISLAAVTADFLDYLRKLEAEKVEEGFLADFLAIASKLVLIKSKVLLPALITEEDEAEIKDFELRLKLYKEIKEAVGLLKREWHETPQLYGREYLAGMGPIFYPPKKIDVKVMHDALISIFAEFEKFMKPVSTIKTEIINLKKKIEETFKKLSAEPVQFNKLLASRSRDELIVLFLAILHLIKDQLVRAEQNGHFAEITVARKPKTN